jgi:hypothetical protein
MLRESLGASARKLRIFDFDDTIVRTGSLIRVTDREGNKFVLTPGEYAVYDPRPGDEFDYSDFDRLVDPREIVWTMRILRRIVARGGEVVILTARSSPRPVRQFLRDSGLPDLEVVALGDPDPRRKADYVASRVESGGLDEVEFFDDSHRNVSAVRALSALYPDVRIVVRHVTHRTGL